MIDDLVGDADARARFLERCGLEGILLALSTGGGGAGQRALPLLIADHDWDTLNDRLYKLAADLDSAAARRLLYAVEAALATTPDERRRREPHASAASLLERLREVWGTTHAEIAGDILEPYIAVRTYLDPAPPLPGIGRTWVSLLPPVPIRVGNRAEVRQLDEWLRLAAAVREAEPHTLQELGFHRHAGQLLERLVADLRSLAVDLKRLPTAPLLASCLRRLADAAKPNIPVWTSTVINVLEPQEQDVELDQDLEVPPGTAPSSAVVSRILRDLNR